MNSPAIRTHVVSEAESMIEFILKCCSRITTSCIRSIRFHHRLHMRAHVPFTTNWGSVYEKHLCLFKPLIYFLNILPGKVSQPGLLNDPRIRPKASPAYILPLGYSPSIATPIGTRLFWPLLPSSRQLGKELTLGSTAVKWGSAQLSHIRNIPTTKK